MSVRKAHNSGRNHLRNVVDYYQRLSSLPPHQFEPYTPIPIPASPVSNQFAGSEIGHEKAQSVIDSITSSYAAEGQAHNNPMLPQNAPGGIGAGLHAPFPPPGGMHPPFNFPAGMPPPPFPGMPGAPPLPFGIPGGPPGIPGGPPGAPGSNMRIPPPFPPIPGMPGGMPPVSGGPSPGGLPFLPPGGLPFPPPGAPNFPFPPPGAQGFPPGMPPPSFGAPPPGMAPGMGEKR